MDHLGYESSMSFFSDVAIHERVIEENSWYMFFRGSDSSTVNANPIDKWQTQESIFTNQYSAKGIQCGSHAELLWMVAKSITLLDYPLVIQHTPVEIVSFP